MPDATGPNDHGHGHDDGDDEDDEDQDEDYEDEDEDDEDEDEEDEDGCNNDTKVARTSKETVDAMFFLTDEEERAAR